MPGSAVGQIPSRELEAAEKVVVANSVTTHAIDPTSVLFKWPPLVAKPGQPQVSYCGLYDAKNRMGGYGGFQPFWSKVTLDISGKVVAAETELHEMDEADLRFVTKVCGIFGYDLPAATKLPPLHS